MVYDCDQCNDITCTVSDSECNNDCFFGPEAPLVSLKDAQNPADRIPHYLIPVMQQMYLKCLPDLSVRSSVL